MVKNHDTVSRVMGRPSYWEKRALKAEVEVSALRKQIDLADKALSYRPHGLRASGLDCTPRMRTLHGCTCWKAEYDAAKEALDNE